MARSSRPRFAAFAVLLAAGCGTSHPGAVPAASYDPAALADAVLKEFDRDGNGSLEAADLDACPALKNSLALIDANKDKKLSRDELKARFERYAALGTASITSCSVKVSLNRAPVDKARVVFTPVKAMGPGFKPAAGTTGPDGVATLAVEGETRAGVPAGLYRIEVTKDGPLGKGPLGREVFDDGRSGSGLIDLQLTSPGR